MVFNSFEVPISRSEDSEAFSVKWFLGYSALLCGGTIHSPCFSSLNYANYFV